MINIVACFSGILVLNCILIYIVWNKYSKRIQALVYRKSGKDIVFEKLRKEVTDLRLPKEHSPRI